MMPSCLFAQHDYRPVLEQGKEWHYTYDNYFTGKRYTFYEYVDGDSIVEGRTYKKLHTQEGVSCLREEGAKVYLLDNNGHSNRETLLYDFTKREGDPIANPFEEMELFVSSMDLIDTPDGTFVCWLINYKDDPYMSPPLEVWVEGVGSLSGLTNVFGNYLAGNNIFFDYCKFPDGTVLRSYDFDSITPTSYHPFVEKDKVWKVGWIPEGEAVAKRLSYYYFDGDTVVGGKNCLRMMCHDIHAKEDEITETTLEVTAYVGAFYEEDRKVYGVPKGEDAFVMFYDFGAGVGDMLHICGCDTASVPFWYPTTIDVEVVGKGVSYTDFYKGNYTDVRLNETYRWLEGVGSTTAPVENIHYKTTDRLYRNCLMSCSVGDELIYQCGPDLVDGVSEPDLEAKKRIDFTHTVKTKPKAPARNAADTQTVLLEGEFNSRMLDLNLVNLHDAYTVSITSADGEEVYTKQIRANGILALNIDISSCKTQDYEIRVENDAECYLGTFSHVANAIDALPDVRDSRASGIYDLTGCRLNAEPTRGMYIRNGKKVVRVN